MSARKVISVEITSEQIDALKPLLDLIDESNDMPFFDQGDQIDDARAIIAQPWFSEGDIAVWRATVISGEQARRVYDIVNK